MCGIKCLCTAIQWAPWNSLSTSNGPVLHAGTAHPSAFSVNIRGPPHGQGFLVTLLLCPSEEMVMEEWQCPGDAAGCQQAWLQKPTALHLHRPTLVGAAPCGVMAQPLWGSAEDTGCWESLWQLPAALWAILLLHFQPSTRRSPGLWAGVYFRAPSKTASWLSAGLLKGISWFHINSTGQKSLEKVTLFTVPEHYMHLQRNLQTQPLVLGSSGGGKHEDFSCTLPDGLFRP